MANRYGFEGRVALVTGGASGIGAATAERLRGGGADVHIFDLVNGEDVRNSAQLDAAIDQLSRLDILVCSAGVAGDSIHTEEISDDEWNRVLSINLTGVLYANRAAIRKMKPAGYGRIVNIASNVILAGTPNLAQYVASKGGVFAFTRALAREIGKYGITVNAVAPGLTETEGVLASPHAEAFEFVQMLQCIPRRAVAADIAPSVAFLASEEAGWVTGQLVVADGGMSHN